jgi:hypothetical protein
MLLDFFACGYESRVYSVFKEQPTRDSWEPAGKQLAFPPDSIHTFFISHMPFVKIIFVVFSDGYALRSSVCRPQPKQTHHGGTETRRHGEEQEQGEEIKENVPPVSFQVLSFLLSSVKV